MTGSGAAMTAIGLAAVGAAGAVAAAVTRRRRHPRGGVVEHEPGARDPLARVLRCRLGAVQVPVWPAANGELYVAAAEPRPGSPLPPTLRRDVLEPLLRRVAATGGQVYPHDGAPFDLLIELPADPAPALRAYHLLHACLRDHAAILARWSADGAVPGPVAVTLTGALSARALLDGQAAERYAGADGTFDDLGAPDAPPALVPLLSEHWSWRFGWDGREPMPPEERHLLHGLVRAAHAEGRRVRFLGVPERPRRVRAAFWAELSAAGVDLLGSRDTRALVRHLRAGERRARRAARSRSPRAVGAGAG